MTINISPIIFSLGPFAVRWYGAMYVLAFATFAWLMVQRIKGKEVLVNKDQLFDYMVAAAIGLLLGGRLGYALFYAPSFYFANPLQIIWPFHAGQFVGIGGMSFHGGLIGVITATYWFARKHNWSFWQLADNFVPAIPLAYTWGRIGNFLNGELWGRPTKAPIGMIFPRDPLGVPRHPSQLYEAFLEGIIVGVFLWKFRNHPKLQGKLLPAFLMLYAIARFIVEFFREPDTHLGAILGPLSMGQVLSTIMFFVGWYICFSLHYQGEVKKDDKKK